ncbi:5-formyltetrahydrofolate cyclo-ligase [Halobacteriovorax sp.]|uniref:5-formyltetrahydrofolate cyclo-ligase n=1 Tax=Halobacteriovorax sp. TaxID=2020862 RepID=UPI003AF29F06
MSSEKKNLRKEVLNIIAQMDPQEFEIQSAKVVSNLVTLFKSENFYPQTLGIFYPIPGEVNCLNLKVLGSLAFPVFDEDSNDMEFKSSSLSELKTINAFGKEFKVPCKSSQIVEPDIILIPGVAFDESGHRLGRGKGYYDRYLTNRKKKEPLKIGVCFNQQLQESIPCEQHDQVMDFVVTAKKVIKV